MINKILNIWIIGLIILCVLGLTVTPFMASIILLFIFDDLSWLLFNLAYIILFPVITVMWKFIGDVISDGGIL